MPVIAPTVRLNNGKEMPVLGLGTFMVQKGGEEVIKAAINAGYRSFDTAFVYHSEKPLGKAIREKIADGTVKREDLFITSKLWCSYAHPGLVVKACKKTVENLGLDYVDLYLIHWPFAFKNVNSPEEPISKEFYDGIELLSIPEYFPKDESGNLMLSDADYVDTWKEMEKCVELGLAKSIGISNFNSQQVERLLQHATIKPVVNQVECHPYFNQKKLREFCHQRGIIITAYGPLGSAFSPEIPGVPKLLENPTIVKIAQKYSKTVPQVILRFLVQLGTIVIPKTSNPKRLVENISIFDFSLTPEEMTEMEGLNCNHRIYVVPGIENHKNNPFNAEF